MSPNKRKARQQAAEQQSQQRAAARAAAAKPHSHKIDRSALSPRKPGGRSAQRAVP